LKLAILTFGGRTFAVSLLYSKNPVGFPTIFCLLNA
jgi:hypothetical protein